MQKGDNYEFPKTDSGEDQFNFKDDDSENVNDDDLRDLQENIAPEARTSIWSIGPDDDKFMKELVKFIFIFTFVSRQYNIEHAHFHRSLDKLIKMISFLFA